MRKIKLSFVALATLVSGIFVFTGCSNEEESVVQSHSNFRTFSNGEMVDLGHLVNEFYERAVTFRTGRTATAVEEVMKYDCTEIIIDSDTRARGYLISDHTTGKFLYFADVDRTNYVFKAKDLITNDRETIRHIDDHPDYGHSDGFDIIGIIGGVVGVQPMGWFWGEYCTMDADENGYAVFHFEPATSGSPALTLCMYTCVKRRFGISFGEPYSKPSGCGD